ncbi:MAG: hypothetical protein Q9211_005252 [Gyalolechia sp. 1 TL-2023]
MLVHGLLSSEPTPAGTSSKIVKTLGESIDQPSGLSCRFRRTGQGNHLPSKDLYSATLHALLHFSLLSYQGHAELYTTRGPEPLGNVLVKAIPFVLPAANTLNCHMAWALYWSIVAFNVPVNTRETLADIAIHGVPMGDIYYLDSPQAPVATKERSREILANLTSASALQMLTIMDDDLPHNTMARLNTPNLGIDWHIVPNGGSIRRETAYDAVAYAILWTAQFPESTEVGGFRQLSVPGGSVVVQLMSFQIGRHPPITLGLTATVANTIPLYLEKLGHFREALATVYTQDRRVCAQVAIRKRKLGGENA